MESNSSVLSDIAYITVEIPTHIYPILGFLSELEAQGIGFDVYGPKSIMQSVIGKMGTNQFGFEEVEDRKTGGLFESIYQRFLKIVPLIEATWEENNKKPQLIIADVFATYAKYLAKKHSIPLLVFHSNYFAAQLADMNLREMFADIARMKRDESLIPLQKVVEEKYGMPLECVQDIAIEGDRNFSCLPEFLGDPITLKQERFSYIGPAFRDERQSDRFDIDPEFIKDNSLIYVSLGVFPLNKSGYTSYEAIIDALGDTEHKVLISAAMGKAEELIARGLPKNIVVKSWVPQMQVLKHSKLFISHVGAGGFMEAMLNGVPIVAVPNYGDQLVSAEMIERLNVGRQLKDKSAEGVKKLAEEVLQDGEIRVNCEKYKGMIDPKASKSRFIEIVNSMIN